MTLRSAISALALLLAALAPALDTGWVFAGSASVTSNGDASWTNPANAAGANTGTYAYASVGNGDISDDLNLTNYDLAALPSTATVDGVEVALYQQRNGVGQVRDYKVQLIIEGSALGSNRATGSIVSTTAGERLYGSAVDTWSLSLAASQLKSSTSGVKISFESTNGSGDARVMYAAIRVHYTESEPAPWYSTSWSHRVRGYIDAAYVSEAVPVVPIWAPTDATGWFGAVRSDGADIRVTADDGVTLLEHYLVKIDTVAPYCLLLVDVDGVADPVVDGYVHVYAGNPGAVSASSGSAVFSGSGTIAMWALTESGGANAIDITGGGYTATSSGSMNSADNVAGHRTGMPALDFDGIDDHLSIAGTLFDALRTAGAYTIGMWADVDSTAVDQRLFYSGNPPYHEFFLWMDAGGTGPSWAAAQRNTSDSQLKLNENGNDASANTWTWPVATWTGSTLAIYKNGSLRASGSMSTMADENATAYIGRFNTQYADAQIAMPFVDSVARSANYLATLYAAWTNPNFMVWGSEENVPSIGAWWLPLALE